MPRKSKESRIEELENRLKIYEEAMERLDKRNQELVDAEEDTFFHSPTYLQMKEQINFLENLNKLNDMHLAMEKKRVKSADDSIRQIYEDNKRLVSEKTDMEYFIGITENQHQAHEYMDLRKELTELNGKIEQCEIALSERDAEISRLQQKLAESVLKINNGNESGKNSRGAGRKKEDDRWKQKFDQFCILYNDKEPMVKIMEKMQISRATYFRFKKRYLEKVSLDGSAEPNKNLEAMTQ